MTIYMNDVAWYPQSMHSLHHLTSHIKQYGMKHRPLYLVSVMIFFLMIFDGILAYALPNLIIQDGFSNAEMGIILGSSSIVGAVFDFVLGKIIRKPHYRRLYFAVFILSFVFLLLLYGANTLWMYLAAMAAWGMYWDLYHFANIDFVSSTMPEPERASSFGVMSVFQSLGSLIAPILAGIAVGSVWQGTTFTMSLVMLFFSICIFVLIHFIDAERSDCNPRKSTVSIVKELVYWTKIGHQLLPLLILTLLAFTVDAFFWTIGPLIAESPEYGEYGGLLLAAYSFPVLFIGWIVGRLTAKYGKKRVALYSFLIGSLLLIPFSHVRFPTVQVGLIIVASTFFAMTFPALNGVYADYMAETSQFESEIQGLTDFFYNIGWIIGPMAAGIVSEIIGNEQTFTYLGVFCAIITLYLIRITPKKIKVKMS